MTRSKGSRKACDAQQARQRLVDARQFLEAATLLDAPDVVATGAIRAAIAAADASTCYALGGRSNDGNDVSAVALLRRVDAGLAAALKRSVDRKTQAGYERADVSATCVRWADQLLAGAEARLAHCSSARGKVRSVATEGRRRHVAGLVELAKLLLHVEADLEDVTVEHLVVLPFDAELAELLGLRP